MKVTPHRDEMPLMRELGLDISGHAPDEVAFLGAVPFPEGGGEVLVESGSYKVGAMDYVGARRLTIDDHRLPRLTVITALGSVHFPACWAFAELLMSGVRLEVVTRAASRLLQQDQYQFVTVPRSPAQASLAGPPGAET